eukprot:1052287-Rhodomonas_salina.2
MMGTTHVGLLMSASGWYRNYLYRGSGRGLKAPDEAQCCVQQKLLHFAMHRLRAAPRCHAIRAIPQAPLHA